MSLTPFQLEAWIEFAIGVVILSSRIVYRAWKQGRDWHGDDYFAVAAVCFLTGETVMLQLIGQWGTIVGITDQKALSLTEEEKANLVKGSKADISGWCLYITLIWCLKACMLFFYRRLTLDTRQIWLVNIAGIASICSYIATMGVILLRCLPFHKNWQVYPYPGDECATPGQIFLTLVVTNVSTDLLILYIPLPLLWALQAPLSRKLAYGLWLTTGIFVIVATLLRCILSIRFSNEVDVSTIWAIRETFVGIIAVNAPILGPFLVRECSNIASSLSSKNGSNQDPNSGLPSLVTFGQGGIRLNRLKRMGKSPITTTVTDWGMTVNESQEHVVRQQDATSSLPTTSHSNVSTIHVSQEVV